MWRRFRRRTLAPRRPLLWPGQRLLAAVTVLVLVTSAGYALYVVFS
jgi:hypothetical protein